MPSRLWIALIVVFWLATTAWLIQRDIWPRLRGGDPPPFTIDLADEAIRDAPRVTWIVKRGTRRVGTLDTWVLYHAPDDTFELHSEISKRLELGFVGIIGIELTHGHSMYRVTREGVLRELRSENAMRLIGLGIDCAVFVEGKVRDGIFAPKGWLSVAGERQSLDLTAVEVSNQGSILNPLHPVNRITGIRPGQHWRLPLVDPLRDSLVGMLRKNPAAEMLLEKLPQKHVLRAEVSDKPQLLSWGGKEIPCLVISYEADEGLSAQTWLRAEDGLVLKQEATIWGDKLVLEREAR